MIVEVSTISLGQIWSPEKLGLSGECVAWLEGERDMSLAAAAASIPPSVASPVTNARAVAVMDGDKKWALTQYFDAEGSKTR